MITAHHHTHSLRCEAKIVIGVIEIFQTLHATEASPNVVKNKNYAESHIFENIRTLVVSYTISKVAAMPQYQSPKCSEFFYRIVGVRSSLTAFFTVNTDTNMSCLDHVNIICAISNSQSNLIRVFALNKTHDVCFVFRHGPKNYHCLRHRKHVVKYCLISNVAEH